MIKRLIYSYFEDPDFITVGPEAEPVEQVDQYYCEVADRDKFDGLLELFAEDEYEQALIFRRTQIGVDKLVSGMKRRGHAIEAIHGAMPQAKRDAAMRGFREGRIKLLVATNLASRGIDVPAVSNVINYDMPENIEEYLHRIGRTARMGRGGVRRHLRRRVGLRELRADQRAPWRPPEEARPESVQARRRVAPPLLDTGAGPFENGRAARRRGGSP